MQSSSTTLSMVAKSGGRPILTAEQFEREVLLLSSVASSSSSQQQQHSSSSSTTATSDDVTADLHTDNYHGISYDNNSTSPPLLLLPVLVLFTAPWCGPCRLTSPVVAEIMALYRGRIHVLEVNTDDLPDVATTARVSSIPTILLYHDGAVRDVIVGCVARNVLAHSVDKMLEELDKKEKTKTNRKKQQQHH